jgi:hypothetical protein
MVNTCKLLINVVTPNKPKMLRGLDQNGKQYGRKAWGSSGMDNNSAGGEREPTTIVMTLTCIRAQLAHIVNRAEQSKPGLFPNG